VRTVDRAGNVSPNSSVRSFTIDSTRPPAPVITAGPEGFTNVAAPAFSWTSLAPGAFAWDVTAVGAEDPVQSGSGAATSATLRPLPEGEYAFRVSQTTAFGAESAEASRSFTVDLTPPARPLITARPPSPAGPSPAFAWSAEPGTFSRWVVIGPGGGAIQASDTPAASATLGPFAPGAHLFRVSAVDPAGNASEPASEPFTVAGAAAAAQPAARRRATAGALPTRNARLLRPRAGKVLPTRRPVLRWAKGPAGTRLYNVQVFRVVRKRAGTAPAVRKVLSAFPDSRQLRAPSRKMAPGTCYVWRVWPYVGARFATAPLGVSHFCIAGRSVLAKAAAAAASRRRAAPAAG
jgi:hypothetical protein